MSAVTTNETDPAAEAAPAPVATIRVERGTPTPEELAAVLAVLAARGGVGDADQGTDGDRSHSRWTDRSRAMRTLPHPGPGGWRASAFPLPR